MKKLLFASLLLVLAMAIPGSAQTVVTQIPTTCTAYTIYTYQPQGGAYAANPPAGTYTCLPGNVFVSYSGAGGTTQILLADVSATSTATAFLTFPVLASINYQLSCTLFWQNSTTDSDTFTIATPASPTSVVAYGQTFTGSTGGTVTGAVFTGSPLAVTTATATAGATSYLGKIDGTIQNGTTAGNVAFEISQGNGGTATIKAGSYCSAKSVP